MVRRGLKTTVIATVMAMMLAPSFSAFAQTGKSNTSGSWQVENNAWVFRNAEGQSVKGWVVYNQEWYYLNPENGQLKTGWLQLDGKWYFLSTESGAQQGRLLTGWQWIDGYCYYLMPTDDSNYGVLVVNGRTPDGYYVNQSGQWLHGENGDAVYEAGKGLPSAASSQQVAGASRALPGQVLGASRAIAAPGGGSFGGGGGGGSTGGGATTSTTGGAGTATAGTATSGTSTGTATGGSAAGTTGTAGESATVGGANGASTGTEANATTGAESNQPGGNTTENSGTENGGNTTEKPVESENPGNSENTTQPGGTTEEKPGTENGGTTTEKPVETETPGNSENTTQPGGTTEKPGTENGGNTTEKPGTENGGTTTEKPGETETPGNSENTTQPGGTTEEKPGTEPGGTTTEKPVETVTPGNSENTTQPGGNTTEKPGTETGGNTTEKPGETENPGNSENTTQPGETTEKPGTETGGNNAEKPGETVTPGNSENTTQSGETTEKPGTENGENAEEDKKEEEGLAWPANFTIDYNSDKKCFILTFEKGSNLDEINKFLQNDIKIFVTSPENKTTEYSLGNPKQNLMRAGNIFCHDLIGEDKKSYRFNALNISRAAFEPGDNKVQIQVEGYASKEYICQVSKQQLEDGIAGLKDFGEVETKIDDDVRTGVYRVKLVSFRNLTKAQQESLKNLKTLFVDDIEYHEVNTETLQDLCQIGPPSFMSWTKGNDFYFAIGNPPKEMGSHSITIQPEEYKDIKLSYVQKEKKLVKAPEVLELKLNAGKKYYQLSFKGDDRVSKYSYLNGIKSFVVAGQTYTRMGSFHPELLNMGAKYILDDSTGAKEFEDILLFSVPTANADKKQEIRIESEGYELNIISLS